MKQLKVIKLEEYMIDECADLYMDKFSGGYNVFI